MIDRKRLASAAVLCLLSSLPRARCAESPREDGLSAGFDAARALLVGVRAAAEPTAPRPARPVARPQELPENCANLPVVSVRNGEIFKNGVSLGRDASSYRADCDGMVAWTDTRGDLYREAELVASGVSLYDVSWHGGVLVWKDAYGELHRGNDDLGRAGEFVFARYTGDLVWKDSWGELFRNRERLGRAESYAVAERTGDVAWMDGSGTLHRDDRELGRARSWRISDRTGDVGWLDAERNLYKNAVRVGSDVDEFTLREDGKLIWVDAWGETHSA